MELFELESMRKRKVVTENNTINNLNFSSIWTSMIKNAAKCKYYASDIIIDIDCMRKDLEKMITGETLTRYIGYREFGVDHTAFILCRDHKEYRKLQKIVATIDKYGYVSLTLYNLY